VSDRDELFKEACRLAVQHGRFKSAWCGWLEPGSGKIIPVACAGDSPILGHNAETQGDSGAQGDTVFTKLLRSQEPIVTNELGDSVTCVLDREAMVERGDRSMVTLPLVVAGTTVGCFTLVTDEPDIFDDEEMRLLSELAGDISFALDHIQKAETLNYLAYYDGLTGLANHTFFDEKLAQYVSTATHAEGQFALVIADLEQFELVNSTYGRLEGDQLLRQVANRFAESVGDPRCVARIGGDQFAAVITDVTKEGQVARTLETWWEQWLGATYPVNGHELRVSANAGIALFPGDGDDAVSLLKNATTALKSAKTTGARYLFYTSQLSEGIAQKLDLEDKLRLAFEHEEFLLHYQPKVDLESKKLTGVEALIRWQSPSLGLVMPAKFIPLLEETGMIAQVGLWVVQQACRDRSKWLGLGLKAPRVAVNVSMEQLRRGDFVSAMAAILELSGGEAGIDIEVTESLMMQNIGQNLEKLSSIRDLGVGIAIDDFGTGYSSLGYLSRLPVDTLKIDRSFIMTMLDDPSAMTLVSTIISLAHALKLDVVAEGVESQEQAKILRLLRCDQMQGFLISKPLPFDDMAVFLGKGPDACT
jgi:diguanylate cyclase (GGDEF)-like protein